MIASLDAIEAVLALCLVVAAHACLFDRQLVRACCFFVAFALAMTIGWWHFGMPWLAVAELLLGVILTGLSLFYALGLLLPGGSSPLKRDTFSDAWPRKVARVFLVFGWLVMLGSVIHFTIPDMVSLPLDQPLLLAGVVITASAIGAFALHRHLLRRLLAFNLLGSGVFMLLAGVAGPTAAAQALISVGLCVAWLGSMLAALLIRQLVYLAGADSMRGDDDHRERAR
ncbi:MAG: hypothetical protein LC677_13405 [Halomonas sp.]|nr:hypothetical protein [Halomonas sp.]